MGQAAKWAVLAAALAGILFSIGLILEGLNTIDVISSLGSSIMSFVNNCSSVINNVRGALNYICGSPLPFTVLLHVALILPFSRFLIWVSSVIVHYLNQ